MFCERKHFVVEMLSKGNILCRNMFCGRKRCDENVLLENNLWGNISCWKPFVGERFVTAPF